MSIEYRYPRSLAYLAERLGLTGGQAGRRPEKICKQLLTICGMLLPKRPRGAGAGRGMPMGTDYLLLYSGGGMPETEEEQAAVMKAWDRGCTTWARLKDGGNPFAPGAEDDLADGAVRDGAGSATGYSITADSLDDAVTKSKGCPVLEGGATIEVYETFAVM